jgi:hypothetical protein
VRRGRVRVGKLEPNAPGLALRCFPDAVGCARELQSNKSDPALPDEMTLAVASLIRVAKTVTGEVTSPRVAGGGAVCAPMLAEQHVLRQIE